MLRILALLAGFAFITLGVVGFLPNFVIGDKVFGIFATATSNNITLIALGVFALLSALKNSGTSRFFFLLTGLFFAGLAFIGFYWHQDVLLNLLVVNSANNWLHALLSAFFLYIGIAL
jgi:apolipoprotein N-acyltransferase